MTEKEVFRYTILQQISNKQISQVKAAELLKISDRQVRNLLKEMGDKGLKGLISKKRGAKSNNSLSQEVREKVIELIQTHYDDFGPTLAREKLAEHHGLAISVETVRQLMIQSGLHIPRARKTKVHRSRPRRENFGELVQTDASIHDWFEGRRAPCALIVYIDDATSKVTSLQFHESECLDGYFQGLETHLLKYGRPLGIYSDKHAIFAGADRIKDSQYARALRELGIESILANSPQAKGRVERVNRTLQDRLIKELRLRGISTIEEANKFLLEYVEIHNERFSKEPKGSIDTHRPLDSSHNLRFVLARRETRTVSKCLSISFYNKTVNILEDAMKNRLNGAKVEVIQQKTGEIEVYYRGKQLKTGEVYEEAQSKKVLDYKDKNIWEPKKEYKPSENHPWKKFGYQIPLSNRIKRNNRGVI